MKQNYEFTKEIKNSNIGGVFSYFNYDDTKLDEPERDYYFGKSEVKVFLDIEHDYDLQNNGIWCAKVTIKQVTCLLNWVLIIDDEEKETGTIQVDTNRQLGKSQWIIDNRIIFDKNGSYLLEGVSISLNVNEPMIELY